MVKMILVSFIVVSIAFISHEIGHKIVAKRHGLYGVFHIWYPGLLLAIASSFSPVIFAAPGAVRFSFINEREMLDDYTEEMGKIAATGPIINLCLAILFFIAGIMFVIISLFLTNGEYDISNNFILNVINMAVYVNIFMAFFNMFPFGPFDGYKVFRWSKLVWFILILLSGGLYFIPNFLF